MDPPKSPPRTDLPVNSGAELRPTYAPFAMAMGTAMTTWGLMAVSLNVNALWFMSLTGLVLMTWSLRSWTREICRQWESSE